LSGNEWQAFRKVKGGKRRFKGGSGRLSKTGKRINIARLSQERKPSRAKEQKWVGYGDHSTKGKPSRTRKTNFQCKRGGDRKYGCRQGGGGKRETIIREKKMSGSLERGKIVMNLIMTTTVKKKKETPGGKVERGRKKDLGNSSLGRDVRGKGPETSSMTSK